MSNVTRSPALRLSAQVDENIARLMARYGSAIDNGELEAWPPLFTEQCLYRIVTRIDFDAGRDFGIWFCNSRDMLIDRVNSIRSVNVYEPHVYRHVLGPTEIIGASSGPGALTYECETSYMIIRTGYEGEMVVFSAGRYVDRVLVDETCAQFAERSVVTDSYRYDTLVALPL
jgi:anthranilate 1,2-dioxygenase small subunit